MFDNKTSIAAESVVNARNLGSDNIIANGQGAVAAGVLVMNITAHPSMSIDGAPLINKVLERDIDCVKDFLNQGKAIEALERVKEIEEKYKEVFQDAVADNNAKRRLFLNKGTALMLQGYNKEAATCYLEGYECDKQNELSNALRIKAYWLKNDIGGLKKAIAEIPSAHKTSRVIAGHILEAIQLDTKNFPLMPDVVSELCFDDPANCVMAAKFYSFRGNKEKAEEFFNKAKEISPNDWQVLAIEGTMLMGDEPYKTPLLQIKRAKDALQKSWGFIRNQASIPAKSILYIPINLASAYRVLGMHAEEKELVEELYNRFPEDEDVIFKKVLVTEDKKTAAVLAKKLDVSKSFNYAVVVAIACMEAQEYAEVLNILKTAPKNEIYDSFTVEFISVICNKELNSPDEIDAIIKKQKSRAIKSFFSYIKTNNVKELMDAFNLLKKNDSLDFRVELAMRLYRAGYYSEALILYKDVRKVLGTYHAFFHNFLDCLWKLKLLAELKNELESLPLEYLDITVKQYWVAYYDTIGDYDNAIEIAEKILGDVPNNANHICNLLGLYYKHGMEDKITDALKALSYDLNEMDGDFNSKWQIFLLMQECHYPVEELVSKAYLLICQNMDKGEAWADYIAWCMTNLSKAHIENDKTGFVLRDNTSGALRIFLIDDNPAINGNELFEVLRKSDSMAKQLLTVAPKDVIKLGGKGVDLEVFSVNNKYTLLLEILARHIFIKFPDCALSRFDAATPEDAVEQIKDLLNGRQKRVDLLKKCYYIDSLPISIIANMFAIDSISIMSTLSEEKLVIASGLEGERELIADIITKQKGYIVDAITIFNMFYFDLQDSISECLNGQIYISQKTKDIIQHLFKDMQNAIKHRNTGMLSLSKKTDKVRFASFEDLEPMYNAMLSMFSNMLDWVDKNTNIVIPSYKLELSEDQQKSLCLIHGIDTETAIIIEAAIEKSLTILSDDYMFRNMAKSQFDIDGVWLQGVLMYSPKISMDKYACFIIKSVKENHTFISFDARVLLAVLLLDRTECLQDFKSVASRLNNCTSDSAFKVICSFYKLLCESKRQTSYVATILIDSFLGCGRHKDFANRLQALKLLAKHDAIFNVALSEWCFGHFIDDD